MISSQHNFIFIHVPKTGGNSIQNVLKDYSDDVIFTHGKYDDGMESFRVRNPKYDFVKHSTLSHYQSKLPKSLFQKLFKFATIRNPWDRMISYYFSAHKLNFLDEDDDNWKWNRDRFIHLVNTVSNLRHYISEKSIAERAAAKLGITLSNSNGSLDKDIDFLIRFENLNHDFKIVCEKIGIPYTPLVKRNQSKRLHYSNYYDEELKQLVAMRFAEEIEFGGYSFINQDE